MKSINIILLALFICSCTSISNNKTHTPLNYTMSNKLVVPFKGFTYRADYHLIIYLDGHKEIESVEAFIFDNNGKFDFRAVVTDHSNHQRDYVTSKKLFNLRNNESTAIERASKLATGEFSISKDMKTCSLNFSIDESNTIYLLYKGFNEPNNNYSGLTDPGGHSPDGGLPMMFRENSSIGLVDSYVEINGIKYHPVEDLENSVKPWFIAYKAYLTKGFQFALLPAHRTGEVIPQVSDGSTSLKTIHGMEKVVYNSLYEIEKIIYSSSELGSDDAFIEVSFNPPLANIVNLVEGQGSISQFSIRFNKSENRELYGSVTIEKRSKNNIQMELIPSYPSWAEDSRRLQYSIDIKGDNYTVIAKNS